MNRDIGSNFDLDAFRHGAIYVPSAGRIETFLDSQCEQVVTVAGQRFHFAAGEAMQVEYSPKYTDASFAALASQAGLRVVRQPHDNRNWFGLRLLQR